ncbi:MAG: SPOR domain-containing protein, partial [Pseudomonadota bacterium]
KPRCPMRYLIHSPPKGGAEVRIRLSLGGECRDLFDPGLTERYEPEGREVAAVEQIDFAVTNRWMGSLTVTFAEAHEFRVGDGGNGWLEIRLEMGREAVELADARPAPLPLPPATAGAGAAETGPGERSQLVNRAPSTRRGWTPEPERFVVQFGVFGDLAGAGEVLAKLNLSRPVYAGVIDVNGREWHELMTGPYATEAEAEAALARYRPAVPDGWVRALATLPPVFDGAAVPGDSEPAATAVRADAALSSDAERLTRDMRAARAALLAGGNREAVELYTAVLRVPDHEHRIRAREYLGVALERSGRRAEALAEYRAWLDEFTQSDDRARVQARLDGLANADAVPVAHDTVERAPAGAASWEWLGGVSQYYRREVVQLVDDRESRLALSALYNFGDLMLVRHGERYELTARASGSYVYDDNAGDDEEAGEGWVSEAYLAIEDAEWGVALAGGRQTHYGNGVLGRFDGLNGSYRWRPDMTFSAQVGVPLDSARYAANRDRLLYAGGVEWIGIRPGLDIELFALEQSVDGLSDRRALGGEIRYRAERSDWLGLIDYDPSFAVLNQALASVVWQASERIAVTAVYETGKRPFVALRNALAGQSVARISELRATYTDGQLRTLALDRTPDASQGSLGISMPFGDRFRLNAAIAMRDIGATPASGGVTALPATGREWLLNANLVAASLFADGDLTQLRARQDTTRTFERSMLTLDVRLPFGERLRLNPIVSIGQRSWLADGSEQRLLEPALRAYYRVARRLLVEVEAGARWSDRELPAPVVDPFVPDGTEQLLGTYFNIGYRWEF